MATHDYVIANGSGSAVRQDINGAFAAIATNNASTNPGPTTTYAYQSWADTTAGLMKIRNSTNDAWVSLFNLDGSSLGPGKVTFGATEVVFNDAGNDVDFRIEGDTEANLFFIDAGNDRVGIGTNAPDNPLHVAGAGTITRLESSSTTSALRFENSAASDGYVRYVNQDLQFIAADSLAAVIDSSGRLLVNTTTARTDFLNTTTFGSTVQIETVTTSSRGLAITNNSSGNSEALLFLNKANGSITGSSTVVSSGNRLGSIYFQGADGSELVAAAQISAEVDGTPGSNVMPGRLVFYTNSGSSGASPTERMRITSGGYFKASNTGSYQGTSGTYHEFRNSADDVCLYLHNTNASFTANLIHGRATRAASSSYGFLRFDSGNGADTEFYLRGDGNAYADGSWNGGGADYAEYFEWSDGNTTAEDRRGISVVLDGDKIREAVAGEDPIGVISGNPSVVGDADIDRWKGKYLRDDFGTYIWEDYEVEDEDGNTVTQQRRKLNPDYDPDVEYINREDRPEWDCVGLMGKLRIRKGQPTGSRWIKMRDISDSVEEWLVR